MDWYLRVLKKYAVFEGRARRKEYWYFVLINIVIGLALAILDQGLGTYNEETDTGMFNAIYSLLVLIPSIAVAVRRLHDTDRSGWWLLLIFIPILGVIILLVFMCLSGHEGDNRFGPDPIEETVLEM